MKHSAIRLIRSWPRLMLPKKSAMLTLAGLLLAAPGGQALAQGITYVNMFRNDSFMQTADGNSVSPNGAFFSTSAVSYGSVPFSAASVSYGGPASPLNLPTSDGVTFG